MSGINIQTLVISCCSLLCLVGLIICGYYLYKIFGCPKSTKDGKPCSKNCDCVNNACGRGTAADNAPLICCPGGQTDLYGGFDYCTGMPTGSVCWSDAMCANGDCQGNLSGFRKGVCN